MRLALAPIVALLAAVACARHPSATPAPSPAPSTLIVDASVLDGTGAPARRDAVRIAGGRIVEVGRLTRRRGETVVDAHGLTLAPGFIDTHSHHDEGLLQHRDALAAVSQGITTIVAGQDGGSPFPLATFFDSLERTPPAINVAAYVGHGTVRESVMGTDFKRAATPAEVARMQELVRQEMRAGALGLSSGLEYDPGIYSTREEMIALARAAAEFPGGRYISHIRSEDRAFWPAIDEIIAIGREAHLPVQVSHTKLAMRGLWGQADSLLHTLDRARASGVDITADVYPYTYWHSTLTVLFPSRDFADRDSAEFVLREVAPADGLLLGQYGPNPQYAGKTVAQIAQLRGTDPATTLMDLIRDAEAMRVRVGHGVEDVIGTSMDERDVERILAWPHANVSSDGALDGPHPRGFGAFTRVLGRYVRERHVLSLEDAVRKMTSLSAAHVGLRGRGTIAPGMAADLVLFDPATVLDRATPQDPHAVSSGIARVWVNGVVVYEDGRTTGAYPGRVLRRGDSSIPTGRTSGTRG